MKMPAQLDACRNVDGVQRQVGGIANGSSFIVGVGRDPGPAVGFEGEGVGDTYPGSTASRGMRGVEATVKPPTNKPHATPTASHEPIMVKLVWIGDQGGRAARVCDNVAVRIRALMVELECVVVSESAEHCDPEAMDQSDAVFFFCRCASLFPHSDLLCSPPCSLHLSAPISCLSVSAAVFLCLSLSPPSWPLPFSCL